MTALRKMGIPMVSIDRRIGGTARVCIDHAASSAAVATHLIGPGHANIAYLAGPSDSDDTLAHVRDEFVKGALVIRGGRPPKPPHDHPAPG